MSNKKKFKFPYFYTILILLLVAGVCAVSYGLSKLELWLADYEASQPQYAAQKVFDTYFANPDIAALIKEKEYSVSPAESFEDLERYVNNQIGTDSITYTKTTADIEGKTQNYVVSAGNHSFARFSIVDSGECTEYNNPIYVLGEYEFFYSVEHTSVKITAPYDAKVFVNGYELNETHIIETKETESCLHMPSKILNSDNTAEGIKYSTYVLQGLLFPTEDIKVVDKYGDMCKVEKKEDGVFSSEINYNSEKEQLYSENALLFAKGYAKYAQGCGSFSDFSKMIDPDSSLYYKVRTLANHFVHAHDTCEFSAEKTSEFYEYAPDVFSCRVTFTWHAYRKNAPEAYEYINMTLYFHEIDGEYVIYDMMTHSDFSE